MMRHGDGMGPPMDHRNMPGRGGRDGNYNPRNDDMADGPPMRSRGRGAPFPPRGSRGGGPDGPPMRSSAHIDRDRDRGSDDEPQYSSDVQPPLMRGGRGMRGARGMRGGRGGRDDFMGQPNDRERDQRPDRDMDRGDRDREDRMRDKERDRDRDRDRDGGPGDRDGMRPERQGPPRGERGEREEGDSHKIIRKARGGGPDH